MGNTELVRPSRDGDQFHYLWASRKALLLLHPMSGLDTLTIEGPSKFEFLEEIEDSEEIIDVGEYYGSYDFLKAKKVIYSQLKHSTVNESKPFNPSGIEKTLQGFAQRYSALIIKASKEEVLKKLEFHFISNRSINADFYKTIKELQDKGETLDKTNLAKLQKFTSFEDQDLIDFIRLVKFPSQEPNYLEQREILKQEITGYLTGADVNAPTELKELITRKALSENAQSPEIRKIDVLRALGTNIDDLFPVKNLIKKLDKVVERPQAEEIINEIKSSSCQKFIIQAEGGVGKSILSTQINNYINEYSVSIVYDCFGNGDYRRSSSARHTHKIALVQIANELAALGLCHPLIPSFNAISNDYIKAFLYRLKQASGKVFEKNQDATLFIIIDAADNSQMAADEFGYGRSFITDLLQEKLPENVKLIALSRPYRVDLLTPNHNIKILTLDSFTLSETKEHLLNYYTNLTDQDVIEFHRLTSGNPRVQSIALGQLLPLTQILELFGQTPKNVEDTIKDLLDKAIKTVKEQNFLESKQIDLLLSSIAILRPLIPINTLSKLTDIKEEQIRSIISDIGGHPIRLSDNYIQFVDEPTETWFRESYKPKNNILIAEYVEKLKPLAESSTYVASVLPQLLMDAGKFEDLVELSLKSENLPNVSPMERRNVELQRLQFAIKAGIKLNKYTEVAKLALKAGGEAAAENRQNQLLEKNIDLIGINFEANQILELISYKIFKGGSWQGSHYIAEAKLLSYKSELHGEARSKLRIATQWLRGWFDLPEEQRRNEKVEFRELGDYFITLLNLEGVEKAVLWLNKSWKKFVSYHVGLSVTEELIRHKKLTTINQIIEASGNNLFLVLSLVDGLKQNHCENNSLILLKAFKSLKKRKVKLDVELKSILNFLEVTFKINICNAQEAYNILTIYMPDKLPYELYDRYGSTDRSIYMKAYALYKAWNNQKLELAELVPERLQEAFSRADNHASSDEMVIIKRDLAAVLPWYNLYAKCVVEKIENHDLVELIEKTKEETERAKNYTYRDKGYHLENEIACIWFDILLVNESLNSITYSDIINYLTDKIYFKTRNYFTSILSLNEKKELNDFCYRNVSHNLKQISLSEDHAETLVDEYVSIAKSIFPLDPQEANEILKEAIKISNKLGEENLFRWNALLCYAEKAGQIKENRPILTYKFSQCAELTYQYVYKDSHFPWSHTIQAIYDLDSSSAFAISSRWRDRNFGEDRKILNNLVLKLLAESNISALTSLALLPMGGSYYLDKIVEKIKKIELEDSIKQKIIYGIYQYIIIPNPSHENLDIFKNFYSYLNIKNEKIEFYLKSNFSVQSLEAVVNKPPLSDSIKHEFNWDNFFKDCMDNSNCINLDLIFEKFNKLENRDALRNVFYIRLLKVIDAAQVICFLDMWFKDPENGIFELDNFLKNFPENFYKRLSVKRYLGEKIQEFCQRNALEIELSRYYKNINLERFTLITDISENVYIDCLLKGVSEYSSLLHSEKLFNLSNFLNRMINPDQAAEVLEYGLQLLKDDLDSDIADGSWHDNLIPPVQLIESIAGYIWSGLASPFKTIRWQAKHTVKLLCDFKQENIISALISFIEIKKYTSFYDQKFEFYKFSAIQSLLIVLLKFSYEKDNFLSNYILMFKSLTDISRPHLIIRIISSKIIINLFKLNLISLSDEELNFYKNIGKSSFEKIDENKVDFTAYLNIGDKDYDIFGIDFGPYWLEPLGAMFGLHSKYIYFETYTVLNNEMGFKKEKNRIEDQRYKINIYDWNNTRHSHGSSPSVEDLNFYLSYHAMMITADKLLQSRPLVESQYLTRDYTEWVKEHALSGFDQYWLSDFRDPIPKLTTEWGGSYKHSQFNWTYSCSSIDYTDAINLHGGEFFLWGDWTEVNENSKDIRVRSSLVNSKTSEALWRALRASEASYEYSLPNAGSESFELDEDPFKLKGWIIEEDYYGSSAFENDPWSASLNYLGIRPANEIISLMDLSSDALKKCWFYKEELVVKLDIWGEYKHEDNYKYTEYSNGYRLEVNKKFILKLLQKIGMDMIISVDINRRHAYGSYAYKQDKEGLDEYIPSSKKVYLLKSSGEIYVY